MEQLLFELTSSIHLATFSNSKLLSINEIKEYVSSQEGSIQILKWKFLKNVGLDIYTKYCNEPHFIWILNSYTALEMLLCSGDVDEWDIVLETLLTIFDYDESTKTPIRLCLAVSIALTSPVKSLAIPNNSINPLNRYKSFLGWLESDKLFPQFVNLRCWHMRYVVGSWAEDCELEWARQNVLPDYKVPDWIGEVTHQMMSYKDVNDDGISVHDGVAYYNYEPVTLQKMLEVGAVCGGVSKFGVGVTQAFGVPALPVGQPGHCAFLWRKCGEWVLSNDVSGLEKSLVHDGIKWSWRRDACYIILMEKAQRNFDQFSLSERMRIVTEIIEATNCGKFEILENAATLCPYNFRIWEDLSPCLDHPESLEISSINFNIKFNATNTVSIENTSNDILLDLKYILKRKAKLLLHDHPQVVGHISRMIEAAGYIIISHGKPCSVSDCNDRAINLTDGTGSEWWTSHNSAWIRIDLQDQFNVSEVKVKWWGISVSKRYKILSSPSTDSVMKEVRCESDAIESPGEDEYNAWSVIPGWVPVTRVIQLEMQDGVLDPWGKGKYFGIRSVLVMGKLVI